MQPEVVGPARHADRVMGLSRSGGQRDFCGQWPRTVRPAAAGGLALTSTIPRSTGAPTGRRRSRLYFEQSRRHLNLCGCRSTPGPGTRGPPEPMTTPSSWKRRPQLLEGTESALPSVLESGGPTPGRLLRSGPRDPPGPPAPDSRGQPLQELDWSPDGQWLVFGAAPCLGRAWGSFARHEGRLPADRCCLQHRAARWSPDGQRIAFNR